MRKGNDAAAGDFAKGFDSLKAAGDQTQKIADPLAGAISKQFPTSSRATALPRPSTSASP